MTTVLAVYDVDGCVGRCDAKCHQAATGECDCICGGRNHGCGTSRAIENTQNLIDPLGDLTRAFAHAHNLDAATLTVTTGNPVLFT